MTVQLSLPQSALSSKAQLLLEQSRSYTRDGAALPKLELAVQTLRRALELEPDSAFLQAEMAHLLAIIHAEYPDKGRRDEALALCDQALGADPELITAWLARGRISMLDGDGENAAAAAQKAIAIDPLDVRGHVLNGRALLKQGRQEEGLKELRQAVELAGGAITARYVLATALMRLGEMDEAATEFKKALEYAPGHVSAMNNLANVYLYTGRYLEAVAPLPPRPRTAAR